MMIEESKKESLSVLQIVQKRKWMILVSASIALLVCCCLEGTVETKTIAHRTTTTRRLLQRSIHKKRRRLPEEDDEEEEDNNNEKDEEEEDYDPDEQIDYDDQLDDDIDGNLEDDFFTDGLTDDTYSYKEDNRVTMDDFYAFEVDHTPKLLPLTDRETIGYVLIVMALTIGASGGIGGGGVVVPVYLLVMGLSPRIAIPIGSVTVLGGVLSSTMLNWTRRHPLADRPLIDWDLVLIMEPMTLMGTVFGTIFHRIVSEKLLIVLLVLLLSITAHATLKKAMRMYSAERRYMRHLKEAMSEPPTLSPPKAIWGGNSPKSEDENEQDDNGLEKEEKERILILNPDYVTLRSDLVEQEKMTPRNKILAVLFMFGVLIFLNCMVGGDDYKSPWDIRCGSYSFWVVHVIMVAFLMASSWVAHTYMIARHEIKDMVRFTYVDGDLKWNSKSSIIYPVLFTAAGLFAGMFGIGGGIIIVPLLLTLGVHPAVASATSSAMILLTSFATSSTYAIFGLILQDYAIFGFCVAFVSSFIGQKVMKQLRQARSATGRHFERNSYIAFVIGGVVLVSALLMTIQYVLNIVEEPDEDFGGLCDSLRF